MLPVHFHNISPEKAEDYLWDKYSFFSDGVQVLSVRGRKIAQELGLALPDTKRYTKKERKRKSVKEWRQKNKERLRAYKRAWMYAKRHDKARPHGNRSWPQAQTRSYASYLAEWREKNPKMTEARREEIRDRIAKETAKNRAC